MDKPLIIIGGGGHASVLIDALRMRVSKIHGVLVADAREASSGIKNVPILGDDSAIADFPADTVLLVNAVGSVHVPKRRREVFEKFKKLGYSFASVIHPSAVIASDVTLGEGSQIMAGAVIQTGSAIGANAIVNTNATVDHDCSIGNHVHIAPAAALSGECRIGDATHVGVGATVIQRIAVGAGCVIAAGAVVVDDMPDGSVVAGVPAKKMTGKND